MVHGRRFGREAQNEIRELEPPGQPYFAIHSWSSRVSEHHQRDGGECRYGYKNQHDSTDDIVKLSVNVLPHDVLVRRGPQNRVIGKWHHYHPEDNGYIYQLQWRTPVNAITIARVNIATQVPVN